MHIHHFMGWKKCKRCGGRIYLDIHNKICRYMCGYKINIVQDVISETDSTRSRDTTTSNTQNRQTDRH